MGRIAGALLCVGVLALVLFGIGNVSCYSAPNPACGFLCDSTNNFQCPTDYSCSQAAGVCLLNSAPAGTRCYADAAPGPEGIDGDPTAPMIISTTPANGDTNVPPQTSITIVLTQAVLPINMTTIQILDGATPIPWQATTGGSQITLQPQIALPGSKVITVKLSGLANTTALHVPLADTTFSFTTLDNIAPVVALSSPLDGATMVPVTAAIVVTFSEPVAGVDTTSFLVAQGGTPISGAVSSNVDGSQWTFTPTSLPAASVITVQLAGTIHDLVGNPLTTTTLSFTTQ